MHLRRQLVLTILILIAALPVTARSDQTDWVIEPKFEFSIRCSKKPERIEYAGMSGVIVNQIYLKVEGGNLSRLEYLTSINSPHDWSTESPVFYTNVKYGGKSKIESTRKYKKTVTETTSRIEVSLDASAAQDTLNLLLSDFVTFGNWTIHKNSKTLTLEENTSIFVDGKLNKSSSTYWTACKLMTYDGKDVYF